LVFHLLPTHIVFDIVLFQSTFIGAIAIGDLIKSTLGPKGMDKILQSSSKNDALQVTNDGATILKSIGVDNPAAKVLVGQSLLLYYYCCSSVQETNRYGRCIVISNLQRYPRCRTMK
jgi:hypothetical protein